MNRIGLAIVCLAFQASNECIAQSPDAFVSLYRNTSDLYSNAKVVLAASDGGFLSYGTLSAFGEPLLVLKSNNAGTLEWSARYSSPSPYPMATAALKTSDGGYLLGGEFGCSNHFCGASRNFGLVKLNAVGDIEWQRNYGLSTFYDDKDGTCRDNSETLTSLVHAGDGGYLLLGTRQPGLVYNDLWLVKIDAAGTLQWQKSFGGTQEETVTTPGSLAVDEKSGHIFVTSLTRSYGAGVQDVLVLELEADGDLLWKRTFGGTGADIPVAVIPRSDGGLWIVAGSESFGPVANNNNIWILKLDAARDVVWQKAFGFPFATNAQSAVTNGDQLAVFGSAKNPIDATSDAAAMTIDEQGAVLWASRYDFSTLWHDSAMSATVAENGDYVVSGFAYRNAFLLRMSASGEFGATCLLPSNEIVSVVDTVATQTNPLLFPQVTTAPENPTAGCGFTRLATSNTQTLMCASPLVTFMDGFELDTTEWIWFPPI